MMKHASNDEIDNGNYRTKVRVRVPVKFEIDYVIVGIMDSRKVVNYDGN